MVNTIFYYTSGQQQRVHIATETHTVRALHLHDLYPVLANSLFHSERKAGRLLWCFKPTFLIRCSIRIHITTTISQAYVRALVLSHPAEWHPREVVTANIIPRQRAKPGRLRHIIINNQYDYRDRHRYDSQTIKLLIHRCIGKYILTVLKNNICANDRCQFHSIFYTARRYSPS
jgi:hypothetical protein